VSRHTSTRGKKGQYWIPGDGLERIAQRRKEEWVCFRGARDGLQDRNLGKTSNDLDDSKRAESLERTADAKEMGARDGIRATGAG
jgi:hypothetical protein